MSVEAFLGPGIKRRGEIVEKTRDDLIDEEVEAVQKPALDFEDKLTAQAAALMTGHSIAASQRDELVDHLNMYERFFMRKHENDIQLLIQTMNGKMSEWEKFESPQNLAEAFVAHPDLLLNVVKREMPYSLVNLLPPMPFKRPLFAEMSFKIRGFENGVDFQKGMIIQINVVGFGVPKPYASPMSALIFEETIPYEKLVEIWKRKSPKFVELREHIDTFLHHYFLRLVREKAFANDDVT
jgi:hypothetical protein